MLHHSSIWTNSKNGLDKMREASDADVSRMKLLRFGQGVPTMIQVNSNKSNKINSRSWTGICYGNVTLKDNIQLYEGNSELNTEPDWDTDRVFVETTDHAQWNTRYWYYYNLFRMNLSCVLAPENIQSLWVLTFAGIQSAKPYGRFRFRDIQVSMTGEGLNESDPSLILSFQVHIL